MKTYNWYYNKLCSNLNRRVNKFETFYEFLPAEMRKKAKKVQSTVKSLTLTLHVLDYGYPICEVCGSPHSRIGNRTCGTKCRYILVSRNRVGNGTRDSYIKSIKSRLRNGESTWKLKCQDHNTITCKCVNCEKEYTNSAKYFIQYTCRCQASIAQCEHRRLKPEIFEDLYLKPKNIEPLTAYRGMNFKIQVRHLDCGTVWETYAGNLKLHSCPFCAPEKSKADQIEKYGCLACLTPKARRRRAKTMMRRYGVEHALQNREIFEKNLKSAYNYKDYKLGRKTIKVQGFEPLALDYIINEKNIKPYEIVCGFNSAIPSISYEYRGTLRVYHPDIFIPHLNMLIEVKSDFTYQYAKRLNKIKRAACKALGYRFVFLIMNHDGTRNYDYKR